MSTEAWWAQRRFSPTTVHTHGHANQISAHHTHSQHLQARRTSAHENMHAIQFLAKRHTHTIWAPIPFSHHCDIWVFPFVLFMQNYQQIYREQILNLLGLIMVKCLGNLHDLLFVCSSMFLAHKKSYLSCIRLRDSVLKVLCSSCSVKTELTVFMFGVLMRYVQK